MGRKRNKNAVREQASVAPARVMVREDLIWQLVERSLNCKEVSHKKMTGKSISYRRKTTCTGPKKVGGKKKKALSKFKEETGGQGGCSGRMVARHTRLISQRAW